MWYDACNPRRNFLKFDALMNNFHASSPSARLRALETTITDKLQAVEDNLQEAHNKLDMILERQDVEALSSPSESF